MRKSFEYKARLSPSAARRAERQLALCAELYNAALQERRDAWRFERRSVSARSQMAQFPEIKQIRPELQAVGSQVRQDVIQRRVRTEREEDSLGTRPPMRRVWADHGPRP